MTDKTEQELNIKLATHFLGIKKIYYGDWDEDKISPMFIPSSKPWRTHSIDAIPVPNFTSSLDACFRWLTPKIEYVEVVIFCDKERGSGKQGLGYSAQLRDEADNIKGHSPEWYETPSLALCLAIEKLIDYDVNKEER